ncbi:MAG: vanadium-dependent haloperoxidase [Acidobacteriota bacterium]
MSQRGTVDQHPRPVVGPVSEGSASDRSTVDQHPRPVSGEAVAADAEARVAGVPGCTVPHQCTPTKIKSTGNNGDEKDFPTFIGNFHKGLPHDQFGEVNKAAYQTLLDAVNQKAPFASITPGLGRKFTNPQAGLATDVEGPDPSKLDILSAPKVNSAEAAAEAVEDYWMALLRDVPFIDWDTNSDIAAAAAELSGLSEFTGPKIGGQVTPLSIFRGCADGDMEGPFLSQFLLHPVPYGSLTVSQQQKTVLAGVDYLTDFNTWLSIQNGFPGPFTDAFDPTPRSIRSMRDLGQYVHVDALYEAYLNACLILLGHNAPFDSGNPYEPGHPDQVNQIGFGTFGGPHILSLLTEVATRALKAVWYQKWMVHRRLRPEAYGGLVHLTKSGTKNYPLHTQVLNSVAVARTNAKFGTYLMPMAFPEGSPTHPAYGAGHATVAGACVTILKAWFDDTAALPGTITPSVASADGTALVPVNAQLTIGGELNKVAANIAIGRNMAGVHWRSDYHESARLGEEVALCILQKQRKDYHEKDWSFSLCRFDGTRVTVSRDGITDGNGKKVDLKC